MSHSRREDGEQGASKHWISGWFSVNHRGVIGLQSECRAAKLNSTAANNKKVHTDRFFINIFMKR